MKYYLTVDINPKKHYIHVKGKIQSLSSNVFYLNENFNIIYVSSNGKKINWKMDKEQPHPAFDTVSRPVIFETENDEIEFEYDGYIYEVINDINQLDEEIV